MDSYKSRNYVFDYIGIHSLLFFNLKSEYYEFKVFKYYRRLSAMGRSNESDTETL